jgi:hypothetical protein
MYFGGTVATASPYGTLAPTIAQGSSLNMSFAYATKTLTFPPTIQDGLYEITIYYFYTVAAAITMQSFNLATFNNCMISLVPPDYANGFATVFSPSAGATASIGLCQVLVRVTGQGASIVLNMAPTLSGTVTSADLWVKVLNPQQL